MDCACFYHREKLVAVASYTRHWLASCSAKHECYRSSSWLPNPCTIQVRVMQKSDGLQDQRADSNYTQKVTCANLCTYSHSNLEFGLL